MNQEILDKLVEVANRDHDGHLTITKFTTNWRVGFSHQFDTSINKLPVGETFEEAALNLLEKSVPVQ